MKKPVLNSMLSAEEIVQLESEGFVFDLHDEKKIISRASNQGYEILFLEDGSEVVRAPDGTFLSDWPEV